MIHEAKFTLSVYLENIKHSLFDGFLTETESFFQKKGIFDVVRHLQVDHIALKAFDTAQYREWVKAFRSAGVKTYERDMGDGRSIMLVCFEKEIFLGDYGYTNIVEWMEPKPGKRGLGIDSVDHIELYFPHLDIFQDLLNVKGIAFAPPKRNAHHETVVLRINEKGQEVKFTNKPIERVVIEQGGIFV